MKTPSSLIFVIVCLINGPLFAAGTIPFSCPAESSNIDEMYEAMATGYVWSAPSDVKTTIAFVDEESELFGKKGELNWIGETYASYSTRSSPIDFRGTFKVGYESIGAKECRRQIVLENEIPGRPGFWEGYTTVEICNPILIQFFADANADSVNGVIKYVKGVAAAAEANATKAEAEGRSDAKKLKEKAYLIAGLSRKFSQKLSLGNHHKGLVNYFKKEGKVLPRFKVKLTEFSYRRGQVLFLDLAQLTKTGNFPPSEKSCFMKITHGVSYGVAQGYDFVFPYERNLEARVRTFDDSGQSVVRKKIYKNSWEDFDFTDAGKTFN